MSVEQADRDYSVRVVNRSNNTLKSGMATVAISGAGALVGVAAENPTVLGYSVGLGIIGLGIAGVGRWFGAPDRAQIRRIDASQAARRAAAAKK